MPRAASASRARRRWRTRPRATGWTASPLADRTADERSDRAGPFRVEITREAHAEGLPLPEASTSGAAGLDLRAAIAEPLELAPGERRLIPTGWRIALPAGFEAQVRPRSGLALRHGILIPNAPGTIDADYRGEIQVILMNAGEASHEVVRGDRIAQLVVAPVARPEWVEVEVLDETARGAGGFGHTGRR